MSRTESPSAIRAAEPLRRTNAPSQKRASSHEDEDAGPRKIEKDRRNDDAESQQPDDPALPAVPDIILAARQDHNRRQTE